MQHNSEDRCGGNCPFCDGTIDTYIKLVVRTGLMSFLAYAFGDMHTGLVTPLQLANQLYEFNDVGLIVCKRLKSKNAESLATCQLTVIQLIASNIIKVEVDVNGTKPITHCKLSFQNTSAHLVNYMQLNYTI